MTNEARLRAVAQIAGIQSQHRQHADLGRKDAGARIRRFLSELLAKGELAAVTESLKYTKDDERRGRPNSSKMPISGNVYNALASYRSALALYQRFLEEAAGSTTVEIVAAEPIAEARERLGLERDLQKTLRASIGQLENGLEIIDGGSERAVASGLIDICARDTEGRIVVIELKAGIADRAAIGQILSYMGDIADEEGNLSRGILVAHRFDRKAISAAKIVPSLGLRAYSVRFEFHEPTVAD